MDLSLPACLLRNENLTLPGTRPNSELPDTTETTVISTPCGHPFQNTSTGNVLDDEEILCKNKNYAQNIQRKHLRKVDFETDGCKLTEKSGDTKIAQPNTDLPKLKALVVKSPRFEHIEMKNLKLVNENKKLRSKNEKYKEAITKLKQHKLRLINIVKQSLLIVNRNTELQSKNDEYVKTIAKLKLRNSKLESIEKQNLLLVDQIKELQCKNNECMEKLQKYTNTRAIHETSNNFENVVVKRENDRIVKVKSEIKIEKNFDEKPRVEDYDDEESAETFSNDDTESDEGTETDEDTESDEKTETDQKTVTDEELETPKVSSTMDEVPEMRENTELWRSLSVSPQRTSKTHDVEITEQKVQSKVEKCEIREKDRRDHCNYRNSETKKRTRDEAYQREYHYSPEKDAKRHKGNSSSSLQKSLNPFYVTGRKYGPFSQVVYKGEYAYASGEYLLLGDGVINGIVHNVLRSYGSFFKSKLYRSSYYFARRSIRGLERNLEILPYLPKKVMISIGDIDTTTDYRSYFELKESLQSLFSTLYHKGVKKIVMIPPVKHKYWNDRRYHLDIFLRLQAGTKYDWDYHYMQELSKLMSEFKVEFQVRNMYFIEANDNKKLLERIVNYTSGNRGEESEEETSS